MFKSFKVTLYKDDLSELLNDSFWPVGVSCRIWKDRKNINYSSKNKIEGKHFNNSKLDSDKKRSYNL